MNVREYPVLSAEDDDIVERFAAGVGEDAARVLGYLHRRTAHDNFDDKATRLDVRIGTGLSRGAAREALTHLESDGVVDATSVARHDEGRPPTAWTISSADAFDAVYERHGERLLEHACALARDRDELNVAATTDGSNDALRVALNWRPNPAHTPLFAAAERNDRVTLEWYVGSDRSLASLERGESDVALVGAVTTVRARLDGSPIVPVAVLYQRTMAGIYTTRSRFGEPFTRADQLRGRTVALPSQSEVGVLARLFLAQAGVRDDVDFVESAGEERDALSDGRADAVTGVVMDWREVSDADRRVDAVHVADRFPMYGPVLVTTAATLRERGSALTSFLADATAGWASARTRPADVLRRRSVNDPTKWAATFERIADAFGVDATVREHGWGWQCTDSWDRLRTALEHVNLEVRP